MSKALESTGDSVEFISKESIKQTIEDANSNYNHAIGNEDGQPTDEQLPAYNEYIDGMVDWIYGLSQGRHN